MKELKHPVNLLLLIIILLILLPLEYIMIAVLDSYINPLLSILLTLVTIVILATILAFILQFILIVILKMPYNKYLLASKDFTGNYFLSLNLPGFLLSVMKNKHGALRDMRKSIFYLIKIINPNHVKENAVFTFETWLVTKRDALLFKELGFEVEEMLKPGNRFILKLIYFLINHKMPNFKKWHRISFNKNTLVHIQNRFSNYNEVSYLRIYGS